MILQLSGHNCQYEMENLCRVFLPGEKIILLDEEGGIENTEEKETFVKVILTKADRVITASACVEYDGRYVQEEKTVDLEKAEDENELERILAVCLYNAFVKVTGYFPEWGILTGVRPTKLMHSLINSQDENYAQKYFQDSLLVNEKKTELTRSVCSNENKVLDRIDRDKFSLYIAIPFCPSRCNYCSFVSHSIAGARAKKTIPQYVANLCFELEELGNITCELGLELQTIYIGGGTPTVLNCELMETLLKSIDSSFNTEDVDEYTVEAGRPDTITKENLNLLKSFGVHRISINPQSFVDEVLDQAGRGHDSYTAEAAYLIARSVGFDCINMDLIAGLPGDSTDGFVYSLKKTIDLAPENITVHTLCMKRSAALREHGRSFFEEHRANGMVKSASELLPQNEYIPYYMYRQSLSLGNQENVGWSIENKECLYNILMIEECQTVLAAGAGAVTKLKVPGKNIIERIFNFKYPFEYNNRFDEILNRKSRIKEFYRSV